MKITIEDLTFGDLLDEDGWRPVDLKDLLRAAIEDECRKVARAVAKEAFDAKQAEIVSQMRGWLATATPEELAKL